MTTLNEPLTFDAYEDWAAHCRAAGFDGPYPINGQEHQLHQFVGTRGTAGMWNFEKNKGFAFEQASQSAP